MITIRGFLLALAAASVTTASLASEDVELHVANYDLKSVSGTARLHHDVVVAAETICAEIRPRTESSIKSCVRQKVDETIANSSVPLLVQFHQALPAKSRYEPEPAEASTMTLVSN